MPNKVNHNRCPLCRKKFTAKRHSILKALPYRPLRWVRQGFRSFWVLAPKPELQRVVTVCGHCKWKILRGKTQQYYKWCDTHHIKYKEGVVPRFDTDYIVQHLRNPKKYPKKTVGRGNYWSHGRGTEKGRWVEEHNKLLREHKDPRWVLAKQKEWTDKELKEFRRLLQEDHMIRKAEEAAIMEELNEEFSEPLRGWLEK